MKMPPKEKNPTKTPKEAGAIEEIPLSSGRMDKREAISLEIWEKSIARDEKFRNNMLLVALSFFWFLSILLLITILIFAYHKISPISLHFLMEGQVATIQTFLLSSALTAFLSSVGRILIFKYNNTSSK